MQGDNKSVGKRTPSFLRWAGGKAWLLPLWAKLIQGLEFKAYHEPFVGGGTTFFSLPGEHKCYLSDLNKDLITTYKVVKNDPGAIIKAMKSFKNTEEDYYRVRSSKPRVAANQAARFIYLNQTSFNGLYRVNRKGEYNVPYGFREGWHYDYSRIVIASRMLTLHDAQLYARDFEDALGDVKQGDLVFLDPPYTVSKTLKHNGFIAYNDKIFSLEDQQRLCDCISKIKELGARYMLTNAAHPSLREIFDKLGDPCIVVDRQSTIGGKNAVRGKVGELLYSNIEGMVNYGQGN